MSTETPEKYAAIYHVMLAGDTFEQTAAILFTLVQDTQREHPGKPRKLYLDIQGHRDQRGDYDDDAYELQRHFIMDVLADYLTGYVMPILSADSPGQNNNVPDALHITAE